MKSKDLNERSKKLLKLLVEHYIHDGQPVGSKTLAEDISLAMSPATIRNVMADLEEGGFISSPHTSSGRVPTDQGYRFFVDGLLNTNLKTGFDCSYFTNQLPSGVDVKELVIATSSLLSDMTKLTALVMLPRRSNAVLQHIEFLSLSEKRILVVLVLNKDEVQNRIIHTDRCYSVSELQQAGNFLTAQFMGMELSKIRQSLLCSFHQEKNNIKSIIDAVGKVFDDQELQDDYVVSGESNLFNFPDYANLDKLRELFDAFTQKRNILHLLNQCLDANGVKIYIGNESGYDPFSACSMITTPYHRKGEVVGVLGIIGPTRMPYDQAIAAVDITAKILSEALLE